MPSPYLRALGHPVLQSSVTDPTVAMEAGKPLALLAYLLLSGADVGRDHLVDLLWAHVDVERGRQSLRQALWQIRRRLGQGSVAQVGDRLRLAMPLESDVAAFLKAVTEQRAADAVQLYSGPFFQPFATPGALEFEHWADAMRVRLEAAYARLSEKAATEALEAGKVDSAIAVARRLRDATPERQGAWRLLIDTLRIAGRTPAAFLEADAFEARLDQEGEPAEEATKRLLVELRQTPAAPGDATGGRPAWEPTELVGREAQFAALLAAWGSTVRGRPQFVHVVGEPGLGKTRLLRELRLRLAATGAILVGARPEERDTPYALATDAASALAERPGARGVSRQSAASLVALDPRLASIYAVPPDPSDNHEGERRRLLALGDLMDAVADDRPAAILLDDMHWADPTSSRVLLGAMRRLKGPMLVVTTARPGGMPPVADERAMVLTLDSLDAGAITALLAGFGTFERDELSDEVSAGLHAASGGSPLRVLEALREATARGVMKLHAGAWVVSDTGALLQLWAQMRDPVSRLRRLPDPDNNVLLALSLWAREASIAELETLTELDRPTVEHSCRRLERGGLVVEAQGRWRPLHHTVAELALTVAQPAELVAMHRRVAQVAAPVARETRARREVVRHVWHAGELAELQRWVGSWVREVRVHGDRRAVSLLVDELCAPEVPAEPRQGLIHALPWIVRHPMPRWIGLAAAALVLAVTGVAVQHWAATPVALAVTTSPIAPAPATPAPVVELRDRLARKVPGASGEVVLRGVGGTVVRGDSMARLEDGAATFNAVSLIREDGTSASAEIVYQGRPMGRLDIPTLPEYEMHQLRWLRLRVNGQDLDPAADTVRATAGEPLNLEVAFTYNELCTCAALLTVVRTWEPDRARGWMALSTAAAPRIGGVLAQSFSVTAPATAGTSYLLFVLGRETSGEFVASQTNWKVGKPAWNDGLDLADVTVGDIATVRRDGSLLRQWLGSAREMEVFQAEERSATQDVPNRVGAAVLVLVTTAPGTSDR